MSAIGSYAVLNRAKFPICLAKAQEIHNETTGWWIFKTTQTVGLEAFHQAWRDALVAEVPFDYSGYVLGNYLGVQQEINALELFDEQSEIGRALSKTFTAAFVFDAPPSPPPLVPDRLLAYCRDEYGSEDASDMVDAIQAADAFYHRGFEAITADNLVVFLIQ